MKPRRSSAARERIQLIAAAQCTAVQAPYASCTSAVHTLLLGSRGSRRSSQHAYDAHTINGQTAKKSSQHALSRL